MFNKSLFSSVRNDWKTPKDLYDKLDAEFNFDCDPCPVNPTFDGLNIEWGKCNFVNPPYVESLSNGSKKDTKNP